MNYEQITNHFKPPLFSRDIVSYLVPGSVFFIVAYYFQVSFLMTAIGQTHFNSFGNASIFIILSYVLARTLNIFVRVLGNVVENYFRSVKGHKVISSLKAYFYPGPNLSSTTSNRRTEAERIVFMHKYPLLAEMFERIVVHDLYTDSLVGVWCLLGLMVHQYFFILTLAFFLVSLRNKVVIRRFRESIDLAIERETFPTSP